MRVLLLGGALGRILILDVDVFIVVVDFQVDVAVVQHRRRQTGTLGNVPARRVRRPLGPGGNLGEVIQLFHVPSSPIHRRRTHWPRLSPPTSAVRQRRATGSTTHQRRSSTQGQRRWRPRDALNDEWVGRSAYRSLTPACSRSEPSEWVPTSTAHLAADTFVTARKGARAGGDKPKCRGKPPHAHGPVGAAGDEPGAAVHKRQRRHRRPVPDAPPHEYTSS